jgi:hypothetical protein
MTYNAGYTTGGQIVNVTGWGFNNPNITASLDGTPCTILSYKEDSFECEVGVATAASPAIDTPSVGQHGLRRTLVNSSLSTNSDWVYLSNYEDLTKPDWTRTESLAMTMESSPNIGDRFAHVYKGWFVPPASTRYRFYMSCDDHCQVKMD